MKYIDEYRNPDLLLGLLDAVSILAAGIGREVSLMEICGTHTHAIGRYGIRRLLPKTLRLISGPGCPVCVTSIAGVDRPDMPRSRTKPRMAPPSAVDFAQTTRMSERSGRRSTEGRPMKQSRLHAQHVQLGARA